MSKRSAVSTFRYREDDLQVHLQRNCPGDELSLREEVFTAMTPPLARQIADAWTRLTGPELKAGPCRAGKSRGRISVGRGRVEWLVVTALCTSVVSPAIADGGDGGASPQAADRVQEAVLPNAASVQGVGQGEVAAVPVALVAERTTKGREAARDRDARVRHWYDPIELEIVYTGEIWSNLRGGIEKGTRYLDNLDLMFTVPAETMGIDGGTFFFYVLHNNKKTFSDIVGDVQIVSNIDNDKLWRIFEAWYEQNFLGGRVSVKLGFMDLNAEFDAIEPAGLMILSSHGIGPDFSQAGQSGPSIFPVTMAGARFQWAVNEMLQLRLAVFDGAAGTPSHPRRAALKFGKGEGVLLAGELDLHLRSGWRFVVGTWGYTARFPGIGEQLGLPAEARRGNNGMYAFAHGPLWREGGDGDQGLAGWIRFGIADGRINQLDQYVGSGIIYTGALPGRDADKFGLAVASVRNGNSFRRFGQLVGQPFRRRETNVEVTYRAEVTEWLAFQPDIQWIIHPAAAPFLRNALAVGLRFEIGVQPF